MSATDVDGPITATAPAGVTVASAVIALFSTSSDADVSALSGPPDWVKLGEHAGSGSLPNVTVWAWWPHPDGVTLPTFEFSKPADVVGVVTLGRVEGVNPLSPVDVQLQWLADCDDTDVMAAPAVTTVTADTLVIHLYVATTASAAVAPPPPPPPDPTPETLSLFWSGSEIDLARTRAAGTSTFEWNAVKAFANDFWANPNGSQLTGFNPMGCGGNATAMAQRQAIDAAQFANRAASAVTVELATSRLDRLSTIGNAVVTQMLSTHFDFYNRTKYPLNCTDNIAPGFHLSMYLGKLLYAIDTLEVLGYTFGVSDRVEMVRRFHGWAEVGCKDATTKMLQFYSSASARSNRATPTSGTPNQTAQHYDGTGLPRVSAIALALNNRRAKPIYYAAISQAWTGDTEWDSHIRLWQMDMMDYGYAPEYGIHPAMPDFYRGVSDTDPWKAAHYTSTTVAPLGLVAEMYRRGFDDNWLYDYRTSRGILESVKTAKAYGILDAIQHFCSYAWGWRAVRMQGVDFGTNWVTTGYEDLDNAFIPEALRPADWGRPEALRRTGVFATRGRGAQPMGQGYEIVPAVWFLRAPR
jgi:hypothetical protein